MPTHAVEVVLEVGGVVVGDEGGLEGREVSQHYPVGGRAHNVLGLYVSVDYAVAVAYLQTFEELKQDPQLLELIEEGAGGEAVVEVGMEELPDQVDGEAADLIRDDDFTHIW
eukprot:CAMPEP_0173221784 /NCGR_PEP_ID=MMETSP1142-20121109/2907_1 /TAXON_ID=483371 /ORGANISM="non described non described, Strain CCMP2298" /LENGTH=111 /DNA_ID=CAMNT_0014149841 /DNA_START=2737 /DNA_END=3073 /DNA_ORIENTATION=+